MTDLGQMRPVWSTSKDIANRSTNNIIIFHICDHNTTIYVRSHKNNKTYTTLQSQLLFIEIPKEWLQKCKSVCPGTSQGWKKCVSHSKSKQVPHVFLYSLNSLCSRLLFHFLNIGRTGCGENSIALESSLSWICIDEILVWIILTRHPSTPTLN